MERTFSRRRLFGMAGATSVLPVLAACASAPPTPQVVTKEIVKEVPKEVTRVVETEKVVVVTPTAAPTEDVVYWYWADSPAIGVFFRRTIEIINRRQTRIKVQAENQTALNPAKEKLVQTATAGTGGPDVTYGGWGDEFYEAGWTVALDEYLNKWPRKDDIFPSVVQIFKSKKPPFPLLALPWAAQADMHYYRTDVYQQAGLKPPETFDELLENSRKLNKPPERYGFGLRAADNVGFTLNVMNYLQMNGVVVTDGKGGTGLDGPEAIRTIKDLAQLYYDGVAQPSALQDRFPQMVALFQTGKIAQWSASVNHSVLLVGADKKFDEVTGVTLMPKGRTGKRVVSSSGTGSTMLKASKVKDAAWTFMTMLLEDDIAAEFCNIVAFGPATKAVSARPDIQENRFFRITADSAPYFFQDPYHKNAPRLSVKGPELWQRVLKKEVTPEAMLKELADLMREPSGL